MMISEHMREVSPLYNGLNAPYRNKSSSNVSFNLSSRITRNLQLQRTTVSVDLFTFHSLIQRRFDELGEIV